MTQPKITYPQITHKVTQITHKNTHKIIEKYNTGKHDITHLENDNIDPVKTNKLHQNTQYYKNKNNQLPKKSPKCNKPEAHLEKLKILSLNIDSLKGPKKYLLAAILESENPDILIACETKLHQDIHTNELKIPESYNTYRKDRTKDGGGVLISVKTSLDATLCEELTPECELI